MTIYHKHHIIPRHAGGTDDPSNIVKLTVEEHAEAHRRLFEQYGRWQDELAWKGLTKMIGKEEIISKAQSHFVGKKHKEETKRKIAQAHKGKKISVKTKLALNRTGKKHSEETKQKMQSIAIANNSKQHLPILKGDSHPMRNSYILRQNQSKRMVGNTISLGKPKSEDHKKKIGLANKGKLKGRIPWNKGIKHDNPNIDN
jgi:hypothetical protein